MCDISEWRTAMLAAIAGLMALHQGGRLKGREPHCQDLHRDGVGGISREGSQDNEVWMEGGVLISHRCNTARSKMVDVWLTLSKILTKGNHLIRAINSVRVVVQIIIVVHARATGSLPNKKCLPQQDCSYSDPFPCAPMPVGPSTASPCSVVNR